MKLRSICLVVLSLWALSDYVSAASVDLGAAESFAVLAGSTVTNTGATKIFGDVGVWQGSSVTGFPPGMVSGGAIHNSDAVAEQAQSDLVAAYIAAAGQLCPHDLSGTDLAGLTLTSGVYCFASGAQLTGTLTLDAQGDSNAVFIFQIGSTLMTASGSSVLLINSGQGDNLFWQVGSSATLGTTTDFAGNILALTSITLDTGADIHCGRALARNGAVTMDTNDVSIDAGSCNATTSTTVPEPGTAALLAMGGLLFGLIGYARQSRKPLP